MSIFNPLLRYRRSSYQHTFNTPAGRKVLADLRRFCRADIPTADVNNERTTYLLEGRREVWLRLQSHLQLTDDEVYNLIEDYNINT